MNEPSIEMMQSISVDFCLLICSILFFFHCFARLSPAAGGLFDTWSGHSRGRSWIRRQRWDNRTDGKGRFSWTSNKNTQHILTHQKRCMFLNFSLHFHDLLEWKFWKGRLPDLKCLDLVKDIWEKATEVGLFLLHEFPVVKIQPLPGSFGEASHSAFKSLEPSFQAQPDSQVVLWFPGSPVRQGCDSNTSSGWRAREPKVRTSLLSIAKVYMTANVVLHLRGNLGINVFQLARL